MVSSALTVYFEGPFWVAVLERTDEGRYQAARVVLGAEPSDAELFAYLAHHHHDFRFGPALTAAPPPEAPVRSAKRAQREAKKDADRRPGTRAQQALAEALADRKQVRRTVSRQAREAENERLRALKEQKRKAKHRGR